MNTGLGFTLSLVAVLSGGCQRYDSYVLEVRDIKTHRPVEADVEVSYLGLKDDPFLAPQKRKYAARTDERGWARIRVADDSIWLLLIRSEHAALQAASFDADRGPIPHFGPFEQRDGWVTTRTINGWTIGRPSDRPPTGPGDLEVRLTSAAHPISETGPQRRGSARVPSAEPWKTGP